MLIAILVDGYLGVDLSVIAQVPKRDLSFFFGYLVGCVGGFY